MPLESHPLSPGDSSSASKGTRHRYGRNTESEGSRPVTSYFDLKSQSDEREAQSLVTNHKVNTEDGMKEGDATVKPPSRRTQSIAITGTLKPLDGAASQLARPPQALRGIQRQSFFLGPQSQTTPGATPRAKHSGLPSESDGVLSDNSATLVFSTSWHSITDNEILEKLSKMEGATPGPQHQHSACLSTIRLLSRQLSLVNEAQKKSEKTIQDQSRRYRKVANLMETSSQTEVAVIRKILDILSKDDVEELPVRGPQLTVSDSLTEAIAEAFTPLPTETFAIPPPSPRISTVNDDTISIASSSRVTDNERGSVRSRGSGRSRDRASRPMSTVGEWMGSWWRDSNKSATSFDSSPPNQERLPSPEGEDTERDSRVKKEPQKRKTLNPFSIPSWMSSPKPDNPTTTVSSPDRRRPPRKLSVVITPVAASDGSPTSSRIQPTPTSALIPTIAPQISTPPDASPIPSSRVSVITKATKEEPSTLPSGPHPTHIRAISYATRVMSSDPHSIMVDASVSPFIAQLGQALVLNLKENTSFALREGRGGTKSSNQRTPPAPVASDVPLPASAVVHMEATETRATLVSNLSKTLNKSMLVGVGRRPNPAAVIAAPILSTFKSRSANTSQSSKPIAPDPNGQKAPVAVNGVVPKAGTVEMDSIIPAESRPPTLYLSRKYTSSIADPSFRPSTFSTVPSRFSHKSSNKITDLQTDRFGFIYDTSVYDVNLLAKARAFNNTAPACLTGVRISDREAEVEDEEWWPSYEGELPPSQKKAQLKIMPEPCSCQDGFLKAETKPEEDTLPVELSEPLDTGPIDSSSTADATTEAGPSVNSVNPSTTDIEAKSSEEDAPTVIPNHVCSNTVRVLLQELTKIHDHKQETYQVEWDVLIRRVRGKRDPSSIQGTAQAVFAQASSGAAAFLGLGKPTEDDEEEDEEESWSAGLGFARVRTNKDEWKDIMKFIRAGIPLTCRAKVWFECSSAIELSEPGTFRDLAAEAARIHKEMKNGQGKHVAMEEIEKDVTRTMPLNVFFGGDGQGVDKLRSVLGAYSL
ncbi:hypothetical protein CPB86DRAFT_702657 [Serendipita vermifera]|nr:hypothetical protein CPB86DRAFT_702657 [Serendipita vermifera]